MLKYLCLLLFTWTAFSGVNLKNGNFYIVYTDIVVPGAGKRLEITRTYNSKSTRVGWFGFGWGSDYETWLRPETDGSIVVYENGSGAETRFVPTKGNVVNGKEAAKKIIDVMKKKSKGTFKGRHIKDLQNKLAKDAELRRYYAKKYDIKSNVKPGQVFKTTERGIQTLKVTKKGYSRTFNDGRTEMFNKNGKMTLMEDRNGYKITFQYDPKTKQLKSIRDSEAKQLYFEWYPDGKAKHIWSTGKKKTAYKYTKEDLTESTDVSENTYTYKYDNHYLTEIGYSDKTNMKITYEDKTKFTSSVTDRSKNTTKYKYDANKKNKDLHYWTLVTKKGYDGKEVTNRYEYELKIRPDGSQYTYRVLTIVNGLKTETKYNECCGLPTEITRGDRKTAFKYTPEGLMTEKESFNKDKKIASLKLEYNKKWKKISKVTNEKNWTTFEYDKKGNLKQAKNSTGQAVLLLYGRKGRISKMVDTNKKAKKRRVLSFEYNSLGKPVIISMEKVGKIEVVYDNYGEIKEVKSKQGRDMSLQVTRAFQNLLSIVRPAGVNLSL